MATGWKKDYIRYKEYYLNIVSAYNSKPNLKIYLELMLSLVTITIFVIFAIRPTILTIVELGKELKAKEETSAKLKQKITNLQTASTFLKKESDNLVFVDQAVPKKSNPEIFVGQIETLAAQNSLNILGFASSDVVLFGKSSETKKTRTLEKLALNSSELAFTLSASGTYQNIYSFASQLENLRRPIKFDSFMISTTTTDSGKVLVITIAGRVPFFDRRE